jgi:hypothetical protein
MQPCPSAPVSQPVSRQGRPSRLGQQPAIPACSACAGAPYLPRMPNNPRHGPSALSTERRPMTHNN